MANKKTVVTINGKPYDYEKIEDVAAIQHTLLPDNWKGAKRDGVRLYLAQREELRKQFDRALTYLYKNIVKTAIEDGEEPGGVPIVAISFTSELNFTSLQVAALGKSKMSFKKNFACTSSPVAKDVNQMEFADDGDSLSTALDVESLEKEMAPPPPKPKPADGEKKKRGRPPGSGKKPAGELTEIPGGKA